MISLYTDGACTAHDRHGGWAWVAVGVSGKELRRESGYVADTTNNRMELTAIIRGLSRRWQCTIYTDSRYAISALSTTAATGLNADLVRQGQMLVSLLFPTFVWVRGHAGNKWNELADRLATEARDDGIPLRDRGV